MNAKKSTFRSILLQKCPRCHEGQMFEHAVYSSQFMKMNRNCSHCGLDFIQEPSFYFGAMYFSYVIQLIAGILVYFLLRYTLHPDTEIYALWIIAAAFLMLPFNYRVSRVLWINLFISYKEDAGYEKTERMPSAK